MKVNTGRTTKRSVGTRFAGVTLGFGLLGMGIAVAGPASAASGVPSTGGQDATGGIASDTVDLIGFGVAAFSDDPWTSLPFTNRTWEPQRITAISAPYEMRYNGPGTGATIDPGKAATFNVSPDTVLTMSQDASVTVELLGLVTGEKTSLTVKVNWGDQPSVGYRKGTYLLAYVNGQLVSQVYRDAITNTIPTMPGVDLMPTPRTIRR